MYLRSHVIGYLLSLHSHAHPPLLSMTVLMENLKREVDLLDGAGALAFSTISSDTTALLDDLRALECELAAEITTNTTNSSVDAKESKHSGIEIPALSTTQALISDLRSTLQSASSRWYSLSISSLKAYNHQISKYVKNIASSPKYTMDLDDAYTFPLLLDSYPSSNGGDDLVHSTNRQELVKSIIVHLLKSGHHLAAANLARDCNINQSMDNTIATQFVRLNEILEEMKVRHELTGAVQWLQTQNPAPQSPMEQILLKLHFLQFALYLSGDGSATSGVQAYIYGKEHFPQYFKNYINEIAPAMTLLLYCPTMVADHGNADLRTKITEAYTESVNRRSGHATRMDRFLVDLLQDFDHMHLRQDVFDTLAHEFSVEFCAGMALSGESALFESVLAGFVNLPNFYKYSQLQKRLGRQADAAPSELPFQLPDKNHFLFRHHPIFICPVSKEQLIPLSSRVLASEEDMRDRKRRAVLVSATEKLVPMANPVVVFDHCRHLALKDSVRSLTKGGTEVFKCHYCYKKHRLQDVSDAYFVDL